MNSQDLDESWSQFHRHASRAAGQGLPVLFRGEPKSDWTLIPSIARDTQAAMHADVSPLEDALLRDFRLAVAPILEVDPSSEMEWLFLAQHYGVPTRLLDWTTNPMVALFFAVEAHDNCDAVIHVVDHQISDQYDLFDFRTASPKKEHGGGILGVFALQPNQSKFVFLRPKYTDRRYLNQRSVFSCPAQPYAALEVQPHERLTVRAEWKPRLREVLRTFGVAHSFVYPGLEGAAKEARSFNFDPVKNGRLIHENFVFELRLPQPPGAA
jgi:hypothetical protein